MRQAREIGKKLMRMSSENSEGSIRNSSFHEPSPLSSNNNINNSKITRPVSQESLTSKSNNKTPPSPQQQQQQKQQPQQPPSSPPAQPDVIKKSVGSIMLPMMPKRKSSIVKTTNTAATAAAATTTNDEESQSKGETKPTTTVDVTFMKNFKRGNRSSALDISANSRGSILSRCSVDESCEGITVEGNTNTNVVKSLVQDLEERIKVLQSMVVVVGENKPSLDQAQDPSGGGGGVNRGSGMTMEQKHALEGLSSSFHKLLDSLHIHHYTGSLDDNPTEMKDELDKYSGSRRGSIARGNRRTSLSTSLTERVSASTKKLLESAMTPSSKALLHSVLEPEPSHRRHRTSILTKYTTEGNATDLVVEKDKFSSDLPKELIFDMMRGDDPENSTSAAYLAREYGGVELPEKFTGKKMKKKTLRSIAKKVSISNSFVRTLNVSRCVGMESLEYLPIEFSRLGLKERKRLAHVLSWEGLKVWGFDSFEVEKLSMGTMADYKSQSRPGVDRAFSAPLLKAGNGVEKLLQKGSSYQMNSSLLDTSLSRSIDDGDYDEAELDESEKITSDDGAEVLRISQRGCPVVLIGWALLASPYAQLAMAKNVEDEELIQKAQSAIDSRSSHNKKTMGESARSSLGDVSVEEENDKGHRGSTMSVSSTCSISNHVPWDGGYFFCDKFNITPRSLCQFFRKVEKEYAPRNVNPYHNNVHAADVIQATHAIIQMGGTDLELAYVPIEIYSILLAASLHDVRHPGTSNNYQINAQTELSVIYNDTSVLENMHASRASYLLKLGEGKTEECGDGIRGIMGSMNDDQRKLVRTRIIKAILYTDMSRHFSEVAKMKRHVEAVEDDIQDEMEELEEMAIDENDTDFIPPTPPSFLSRIGRDKHVKIREKMLPYILHMADISNATKTHKVSLEWAHAVYDEFFLQGDKEMAEDMPVSPLCDRNTTNRVESQIGFINFVVKPAFLVLARCLPAVESVIINQMEKNIKYWEGEKTKAKAEKEEKVMIEGEIKEEEES